MTGVTSPDNIRYPNGYEGVVSDVPSDMQTMAGDVQTALNKRTPILLATINISRASGWANNFPQAHKTGKLVVLSSYFQRSATLSVSANTAYTIGTLPAGYRPLVNERIPCAWSDGGVRRNGQVWIMQDGTIDWYPTSTVTLAVNDFVSVSGVCYAVA